MPNPEQPKKTSVKVVEVLRSIFNREVLLAYAKAMALAIFFLGAEILVFHLTKQELPFMALAIAVAASTYGLGPALMISGLSMICEAFFFIEPYNSIAVGSTFGLVKLFLYAATAVLMSIYLSRQKRLLRELKNLVESQRYWVANVSHEIRTPLNGILGFTRLLLESKLSQEQERHLRLIDSSGRRLLGLVSDLLDFSHIQSKKIKLENNSFNPEHELRTVIEVLRPRATERGVFIALKIEGIPNSVHGDSGKFNQIFINLIENAIKFSPQIQARVEVTLQLKTLGNHLKKMEISIQDFGRGISDMDQKSLFTPFFRSRNQTEEMPGGTGLGLSIVKGLVEAMKGQISVNSRVGAGTCFVVSLTLPIFKGSADLNPTALAQPMLWVKNELHPLALLAEDNQINQIIIQTYLERMGFRVDVASNGVEATQMASEHRYNLVIVDRMMPIMDGFEAARLIRSRYLKVGHQQFAIIAMTADASDESFRSARRSGVEHVLTKPIDFDLLKRLIGGSERNSKVSGLKNHDLNQLSKMLGSAALEEILKVFILQAPERFKKLDELLAQGELEELRRLAHNLKSSCLALGAETASHLCFRIEESVKEKKSHELPALVAQLKEEIQVCEEQMKYYLKLSSTRLQTTFSPLDLDFSSDHPMV